MRAVYDEKSERCDPFALSNRVVVDKIIPTPSIILAPMSLLAKSQRPEIDGHYGQPSDQEIHRAKRLRDDLIRITTLHLSTHQFAQLCIRVQEANNMVGWITNSVSSAEGAVNNILEGGAAKNDSLDVIQATIQLVDSGRETHD